MTIEPSETAEERGLRLRAAERAHDAHARAAATISAPLVAMGADILKAASFINGGAAAATIFLVAGSLRDHRPLALALIVPLSGFGFGLAVAAFATGWSYLAQAEQGRALALRERAWSEPFLTDTEASRAAARRAERFQFLAFAAVLASMASAVVGFGLAAVTLFVNLR